MSLCLQVPIGTVVKEEGTMVADLSQHGQEYLAVFGGTGGKGNRFYLSNENRAPMTTTPGIPGQERRLQFELRTMAHAGLVSAQFSEFKVFIEQLHYKDFAENGGNGSNLRRPHWYKKMTYLQYSYCRTMNKLLLFCTSVCPFGGQIMNNKTYLTLSGWISKCRKVLAPEGHFQRHAHCRRLPLHHTEPTRGHREVQGPRASSR